MSEIAAWKSRGRSPSQNVDIDAFALPAEELLEPMRRSGRLEPRAQVTVGPCSPMLSVSAETDMP